MVLHADHLIETSLVATRTIDSGQIMVDTRSILLLRDSLQSDCGEFAFLQPGLHHHDVISQRSFLLQENVHCLRRNMRMRSRTQLGVCVLIYEHKTYSVVAYRLLFHAEKVCGVELAHFPTIDGTCSCRRTMSDIVKTVQDGELSLHVEAYRPKSIATG